MDRDGTIIRYVEYLCSPEELALLNIIMRQVLGDVSLVGISL